jgi:low affinity Fe/Cu permease
MARRSTKAGEGAGSRRAGPFERMAAAAGTFSGSTPALVGAVAVVLAWAASGPLFGYSSTWQLVINTGTTIITFLMVFLIQRSQNKESLAVQLKLNEIVAALQGASNRLVNVQDLTEEELRTLHQHYTALARLAKQEGDLGGSHSVEEAADRHRAKTRGALGAPRARGRRPRLAGRSKE